MALHSIDRYELAAQEDRSAPRTNLTIPAQMRVSGGRAFQTVVHDMSISGFSAAAVNRLVEGQRCFLTLPGLEVRMATVVWWDNSIVGCAFYDLLSPIVHDNIMARHGQAMIFRSI